MDINSPPAAAGHRVLFAVSEVYPLIKTGGLADVACFLPAALTELGYDVRIIVPAYGSVLEKGHDILRETIVSIPGSGQACRLLEIRLPGYHLPVYLVDAPALFRRAGGPYTAPDNTEWPDNHERYALFCRMITAVCRGNAGLDWRPDLLHAND
jgi:starch synthase